MPRDRNNLSAPSAAARPRTARWGETGWSPGGSAVLAAIVLACAGGVGCRGPQSALDPAGEQAERIAGLTWWMFGGAGVVWVIVVGVAAYAITHPRPHDRRQAAIYIIGGGVVFPTLVLAVLLSFGLRELPRLVAPAPEGSLVIEVTGLQWWWDVRYPESGVRLANEVRVPAGEPVQFLLQADDVIHSFWIPSLGGKMDMIPGRETRLSLTVTRTGVFRGACAELCGDSHAIMAFDVVVMEPDAFSRWLQEQARPAQHGAGTLVEQGRTAFLATGCGACHTIRGTEADGVLGPDLTHIGVRVSLSGGALPTDQTGFERWIAHPGTVKPGVHMPSFAMLPPQEIRAIAAYLESLE